MYSIDANLKQVRFDFADPLVQHLCKLYGKSFDNPFGSLKTYTIGGYKIHIDAFHLYNFSKSAYVYYAIPKFILHNDKTILSISATFKVKRYTLMRYYDDMTINEHLIKLHMGI